MKAISLSPSKKTPVVRNNSGCFVFRKSLLMPLMLIVSLVLGCPDEDVSGREMTIFVEADTESLQERELQVAKRMEEIEAERVRLIQERQALLERMEGGDDLTRLVAEQRRLLEEEEQLRRREVVAHLEQSALTEEISSIVEAAASGVLASAAERAESDDSENEETASRAAEVSRREAGMAAREAQLAERERAIAEREAGLAKMEAGVLRHAASAASSAEAGERVSSSEVDAAHRQARRAMHSRGILMADLPPDVAALDRRVVNLSRSGRLEEALDAAESFGEAVEAIEIDEAFVQSKMPRLARARGSKELSREQVREVDDLLAEATSAFIDGRYSDANASLNGISAILSD